jgi:hypothetical protein
MNRRAFLTATTLAVARSLPGAGGATRARLGICTFSCHQHWKAVGAKHEGVKFADAPGFYRYVRGLGAEGAQTPLRGAKPAEMRAMVEGDGGYYEGELRLPKVEGDLPAFEADVRETSEAGASVARAVFTNGRRYEVFKTMEEFRAFHEQAKRALAMIEPVLRKHRLKVAVENHKDHTTEELISLMRGISSEWIGVLVDTGNNMALLDEPHGAVEALAPFALSVHLKDMAVQACDDGFLLSETPLGTGMLDLPRMVATLRKANPAIVINLEMATRDPLRIPCLTDSYFATLPGLKTSHLDAALQRVRANPPRGPVPSVSGKSTAQVLAQEEDNNRHGLGWMHEHLHA